MKIFNYSLITSALVLASTSSIAQTYDVVDIGGVVNTRQSYAIGVNNNDVVVGISKDHFNYPIDLENLNYAALEIALATDKLNNPELYADVVYADILAGNINADGLDYIKRFLDTRRTNNGSQKLGNQSAFVNDDNGTGEVTYFDQVLDGLFNKSRSTIDLINAVNDNGVSVGYGSAMYYQTDFTPEVAEGEEIPESSTIWVKDFVKEKGVIIAGDQKVVIESAFTEYGGASNLTDISENNYVVGYAAVGISQNGQEGLEANCEPLTDPVGIKNCAWVVNNALEAASPPQTLYAYHAMRWKIDQNLQVVETLDLGLSTTPDPDDNRNFASKATGVNEFGHVVGFSEAPRTTSICDNNNTIKPVAVYHDGNAYREFVNSSDYYESKAYDINDNDIVVGYGMDLVNSTCTQKFFYYDAATETTTFPSGFFSSSASVAHGINNAGKVVGTAEVESSFGTTRRKRAFIYDIAADTMTDLNDLTTCDHPYTIAEARDINENGVIVGTALQHVPLKDSQGNVVTDDNGEVVMEQVSRAVKLVPVAGGVVDDCSAVEDPTYERQGAGLGLGGLLLLSAFFGVRRLVR